MKSLRNKLSKSLKLSRRIKTIKNNKQKKDFSKRKKANKPRMKRNVTKKAGAFFGMFSNTSRVQPKIINQNQLQDKYSARQNKMNRQIEIDQTITRDLNNERNKYYYNVDRCINRLKDPSSKQYFYNESKRLKKNIRTSNTSISDAQRLWEECSNKENQEKKI